jgi:hypothetical protein
MSVGRGENGCTFERELQALKVLAKELLNCPAPALADAIRAEKLIEIKVNDDGQ